MSMAALHRLRSLRADRPRFVLLVAVALAALLAFPLVDWYVRSVGLGQPVNFQDFGIYAYTVDVWQAGDPLFEPNQGGGYWGNYLYPPLFLLVFWPFALLPGDFGGAAWGLATTLALWGALQLLVARLGVSLRWWERLVGLWALASFHPLLLSIKLGQTAGLLGALLALAAAGVVGDERPWGVLSGASTAVVGTLKLAYAPVGTHLLADRTRFLSAIAGGVVLVALSLAVFGIDTHRRYLDVLVWGFEHGSGDRIPTPRLWLPAYFKQLHFLPGAQLLRVAIAALVAGAALLAREADRELFCLGVATFLLITPLPYTYYLVAALPAVVLATALEFDVDGLPWVPVACLLLIHLHAYGLRLLSGVVAATLPGAPGWVYPLLQPGLWGVVGLFGLSGLRVAERIEVSPSPIGRLA